jgi:phosphoglycerol transferase MdoB-like AlkP superfamily enzyme
MTEDLILAWRDKEFIIKYVIGYYWYVLLLIFTVFFIALRKCFNFVDKRYNEKPSNLFKGIGIFLAALCVVVLLRRENLSGMPINLADAYKIPKSSENIQLILNGLFVQYYYLKGTNDTKGVIVNKFPYDAAIKKAQEFLLAPDEFIPDMQYPLMRQIKEPKQNAKYNAVVFLLESWTPRYIDSFNETAPQKKYGVTPNFDKIASQGIKFNNAFAAGNRSQYGLFTSLIGLPLVPGTMRFYGLDTMTSFTLMAREFNKRGYFTMYAQSTERSAIGMVNGAKNFLHFEESYGKEDFPVLMEYETNFGNSGYDYDMLDFSARKAAQSHKNNRPFFMYLFTGSTHPPFKKLTKDFEKYGHKDNSLNAYLNSLYYADYSIQSFLDIAIKEGFFDDTIFVFMADHMIMLPDTGNGVRDRFRIPFVIYAPKLFKPQVIDWTVSQGDLIPTLWRLLGIETPFTAIGSDALDKKANHFAFIVDGSDIVLYQGSDFVKNSRLRTVETNLDQNGAHFKNMEETLLSLDKSITETFRFDKWYKSDRQ